MAAKTAPAATAPAAPAAVDFAAIATAAVAAPIPTPAQRALAVNPFTDSVAAILLNGKPRTMEQCTDEEPGSRVLVVPGDVKSENVRKVARLLNDAGNALNVTIRKNLVQGKDDAGNVVTQVQFWAVEKQARPRKG